MKATLLSAIVIGMVISSSIRTHAAEPEWVSYEPAVVKLTGTIVEESYGEDASPIDRGKHAWILRLERPIAVKAKPNDEIDTEEKNVAEVHLNIDRAKHPIDRKQLGHASFTATGTLYHGHTAHHLRDIVMNVSALEPAAK